MKPSSNAVLIVWTYSFHGVFELKPNKFCHNENQKHRIIIGDPSFTSYSGHCYEYMLSLRKCFNRRGYDTVLIGNRGLSSAIVEKSDTIPGFTYWCDARPLSPGVTPDTDRGRNLIRQIHEEAIINDLSKIDEKIKFGNADIFILNTFRHWGLRGIVKWMEKLGGDRAPHIVLILHFTAFPVIDESDVIYKMYQDAFTSIEKSFLRNRFIMMADSDGLISEYQNISNLSFLLAPIPHAAREEVPPPYTKKGVGTINISYLGEARYHKGFHLLPYMINNIKKSSLDERVHFKIQNFCNNPRESFYLTTMGKFYESDNLTFFPSIFDEIEYEAFLNQSDIILIPYLLDNYYIQTSGIYAEAISIGKPVVVSMGTWMASQVKKYGGGRLFPPGDVQGFLIACKEVIQNFQQIKIEAVEASKKWNLFHNSDKLVDIILEAVRG